MLVWEDDGKECVAYLVELVHRTADGPDLVLRDAAYLEDTIENLPVVDLDSELPLPPRQVLKHLLDDPQNLGIGQHGVELARNVKVALVELAHAPLGHGRLVSSVDLGNVVSLDVLDGILGAEARERDGQVVSQGADLTALVGEVVYELAVLAIFACEGFLELEHGSAPVSGV